MGKGKLLCRMTFGVIPIFLFGCAAYNSSVESHMIASIVSHDLKGFNTVLSDGFEVNEVVDEMGSSALHYVAGKGYTRPDGGNPSVDVKFAEILLERGAYVNSQDSLGYTPLMIAIYNGRHDVIRFFLMNDADPSIENELYRSSIDYVVHHCDKRTIEIFRRSEVEILEPKLKASSCSIE